ncbi:MAG: hypothetical protein LIO37_02060 [Clostridiales bacterium]|nr:hypothetical protein [Clostridiales bacterium]
MDKFRNVVSLVLNRCKAAAGSLKKAVSRVPVMCAGARDKISSVFMAWPVSMRVTVPCSVVLMIVGAMLLAMHLHRDLPTDVTFNFGAGTEAETQSSELYAVETEQITEAVTETEPVTEIEPATELQTETETETEDNTLELLSALPTYTSVTIVTESMEKDLTIYFEDKNGDNIKGINFKVKLIDSDQLASLQGYIDAISDSDVSGYVPPEGYESVELSLEQLQSLKKQESISAYASALAAVGGDTLTDDNADGTIYVEDIEAGDYILCYVPVMEYDASQYSVNATVKDEVEYVAVTTIKKKVVTSDEAGDQESTATHTETKVETVAEDTVEEVESSEKVEETVVEAEVVEDLLNASVSEEMNTASSLCELTEEQEDDLGETELPATVSVTVTSTLSISKEIRLYASEYANSVNIQWASENVTEPELYASDDLSFLTIEQTEDGYLITIADPSEVTDDVEGTLTLEGMDALDNTISVTCDVIITGSYSLLTDADGNQLYSKDSSENLDSVTIGDYVPGTKYYTLAESITYYGWQTIDGETYYYDGDGNPVTGKQTINGVTYYFDTNGVLISSGFGIDVSKWQGTIDWEQASTAVSFAIIRCGFRGTSGKLAEDPMYSTNISEAKKYGVSVGIYFYSLATTEAQAIEEASLAVSLAKEAGGLDLPIFIDMEDSTQQALTTEQRDKIMLAFCKTVVNSGYEAGIYSNKYWLTNLLTPSKYSDYMIWCAQYNTECTYTGRYEIWQYSSKGTIPGIKGNVDLNWGYF